jgi:Lrp/AsnC family leucine-responsive transcriptional regulator
MAVDLDDLDHRILTLLLRDGRTPASQLAEQIGLSRPAVADRIEKLERQGVIRGTTVVVDHQALGKRITAFVAARGGTSRTDTKAIKEFESLMESDVVVVGHPVGGDDCNLIKVRTDSIASLNALVSRLGAPPLSLDTRTTIVMETHCEKVGGITLGVEA